MPSPNLREEEQEDFDNAAHARQIFVDGEGYPLYILIDESVRTVGARAKLTNDIENNGGSVVNEDTSADIVIIDHNRIDQGRRQLSYDLHPDKSMRHIYVEPMSFIQRCIRQGHVRHRIREGQGMGGAVGRTRTNFTDDDDLKLCRYLALRIPVKDAGGRFGDNIYKDLVELAAHQPAHYGWVRRHTWQSFRQRYKKNADYFDKIIDRLVKEEEPTAKQVYFRNRAWRGGRRVSLQVDFDDQFHAGDEPGTEEIFQPESGLESEDEIVETLNFDQPGLNNVHGGRQRSQNRRNSLPSTPQKRRRVEQRPQQRPIISQSQVQDKGKRKALPQSDNENSDQLQQNSLFSESEEDVAGPSGTQHTTFPSPTLVSRRLNSPLLGQPPTSQATLVPQQDVQYMPSNKQDQAGTSLPVMSPALAEEQRHMPPMNSPTRSTRKPSEPNSPTIPLVGEQPIETPPTPVRMSSPRRRAAKKKAVPLNLSPNISYDPPYRNTRARSRSVEPSGILTRPIVTKTKRRRKMPQMPLHSQAFEEAMQEEPETSVLSGRNSGGDGVVTIQSIGAVEEERDVAELLVANVTDISTSLEPQMEDTSQNFIDKSNLSTDDEQTTASLGRSHKLPRPQFPTSNIMLDDHPEEILKQLDARSMSSQRSSARPSLTMRSNPLKFGAERFAPSRNSTFFTGVNPQPSTPTNSRKRSPTSSGDSFPLDGTHASTAKRRLEEKEKHSPYVPLPRTRAARHRK